MSNESLIELHADFLRKGDRIALFNGRRGTHTLVRIDRITKNAEGVTLHLANGHHHRATRTHPLVHVPASTAYRM
jgi:hypothetical protein